MSEGKRYRRLRITRRRVLGAGAAAGSLATLTLFGCRKKEEQQPIAATGTPTPKRGGILRLGTSAGVGNLIHLDPHIDSPVYSVHLRLIYQGLLGYDVRTYEVQPQLAAAWEQPSQTEYIFTLQPGVRWQNKPPANGRNLTAEDVAWSLERIRTDNPRFTSASLLRGVQIQVVDGSRIKLVTPEPDAAFLAKISADPFLMMARDVLERAGAAAEPGKLIDPNVVVGTGPFEITFFEEGVRAEYKRNPIYWRAGRPYLDGLLTPYVRSYQEAYSAFLSGQLDVAIVPGQEVRSYTAQQGPNYTPLRARENGSLSFTAPNTRVKPFDDPRVTRALRLLHDYNEIKSTWAETWYGAGRLATYFNPVLEQWDLPEDELLKYLYWKQPKDEAIREALTLLRAAGFDTSNPLRFEVMGRASPQDPVVLAQLVQDQWRKFSQNVVQVDLKLVEISEYQRIRAQRAYTYSVMTNAAGYVDPDGWFQQIYRTGASRNYWNNSDPQLDAMIDKQRTIFNAAERKKMITDIVRYMIDTSPGVTLAYHYYINATQPKVRDFAPEVQPQGQQYEWVWLDT